MDILCNVRTCRKPLTGSLWVTSCSHSFCEAHASTLTHKNIKCPACNTVLGKRFDVIRQNSNPAEDFRAMLLVGLRPEIVLDIAMRAVSFWNYQVEQELKFQCSSAKHFKEAVQKIKDNHAIMMKQLSAAKKTSDSHEKQIGDLRSTIKHLKDQIASKDQQLQKMQRLFNSIKNKTKSWPTNIQNNETDDLLPVPPGDSLHHNAPYGNKTGNNADKNSDFVFEPLFPSKK